MASTQPYTVHLKPRQYEYLTRMAKKHGLPDEAKALRVLVDFALHETADEERIFVPMRCSSC